MRVLTSIVILCLFFAFALPTNTVNAIQGGSLDFENINTKQGLSQNYVRSITQDHYGYMWFGTAYGLNKFDGIEFKVYNKDSAIPGSISNSNINCIYETSDGQLYIGTKSGLNLFNREMETFTAYFNDPNDPNSISNNGVTAIYEDINGRFWIGTGSGLNLFNRETGTFTAYFNDSGNPDSISDNGVTAIYEDSQGRFWIGTGSGLNLFNRETETFTVYLNDPNDPNSISNNYIMAICEDNDGYLWLGTNSGLNKLDVEDMVFINYTNDVSNPSSLTNNRVPAVYKSSEGILWIGTASGINILHFDKQVFKYYKEFLYNNAVSGISSIDGETLWLATNQGLVKFNSRQKTVERIWEDAYLQQGAYANIWNVFCVGTDGCLWFESNNFGLVRFNPVTNELITYTYELGNVNSIPSNDITSLYASHDGTIWIGTAEGLCSYNPNTDEFSRYKNNPEYSDEISNGIVIVTYETSDYTLWFGTESGLYMFDNKTMSMTCVSDKPCPTGDLSGSSIFTIYEGSGNLLWIATNSGLHCYSLAKEEFVSYGIENKALDELIFGVLEDDDGNIWVSFIHGLGKLSLDEGVYTGYGIKDGLRSDSFCLGASYKTEEGELIFGCMEGLISFYPEDVERNIAIPRVVINGFSLIDSQIHPEEPIEDINEITLSYSDNSFEIDFIALSYDSPENNQYAYMLEDFDDSWTYCSSNNNLTRYTNLNSGEYIFKVKAANSDGVWNEEGAFLKIIITPPFWQEWWFILSMIVGVLLVVVMIIIIRTHMLSEYAKKLENQFEEKTCQLIENTGQLEKLSKELKKTNLALGDKMEEQGEYFNALMHDFKTPLTSIVASSDLLPQITEQNKLEVLSDQIQKNALFLKKRIDQHFDIAKGNMNILEARKELISFHDLVKGVIASTSSKLYSKHISLKLNIDSDLLMIYVDEQKLIRVLHNLLDNAYKYTPDGGAIIINVNRNDSCIKVEVHDDGCGMSEEALQNIFKPYYHSNKNEQYHSDSIGLGLAICKTYVNLHGGDIWVQSELGKGTTVVFSIPVNS